jgi:hypothetical protein
MGRRGLRGRRALRSRRRRGRRALRSRRGRGRRGLRGRGRKDLSSRASVSWNKYRGRSEGGGKGERGLLQVTIDSAVELLDVGLSSRTSVNRRRGFVKHVGQRGV